jgi:3-hydroxyacyl-CoA dehydrogenase/enoyl-CoA hydratase/3-hydroxybutyryl-CoA epimerase
VDAVTPRRHFENAARRSCSSPPPRTPPLRRASPTGRACATRREACREEGGEKARRDHYPAPYAIIELWKDFGGDVRNVPREHPASMASLFATRRRSNLIRIFTLQERLKALGQGARRATRDGIRIST